MTIFKNERNRLAFLFGRQSGLRSTSDMVEQLQAQIERLQEQLQFNAAEYERQIAVLTRDLMQAKYELARRESRRCIRKRAEPVDDNALKTASRDCSKLLSRTR